jgi:multiple sugar transport system ATP-binding protein
MRVTTLYVTHDQVEAMAMGDRAAVMRDGRIVQCGTPIDLYDHPVDLFVAQFIGMPPMNVVAATVIAPDGAPALRIGSRTVALGDEGVRALPGVEQLVGRRVGLGFRPESVRRDPDGPLIVSPIWSELRGVDQLVTARIDASRVTETGDGIVVSDDHSSLINVSMPVRDVIDIWKPLPLSIDTAAIHLFDLATGAALCRPDRTAGSAVSTTYRASTSSCGR